MNHYEITAFPLLISNLATAQDRRVTAICSAPAALDTR